MGNKHYRIFVCALIAMFALGMSIMAFPVYAFAHDVAVVSVEPYNTSVGKGYDLNITVTVENKGENPETFTVVVYANGTEVAASQDVVDLAPSTNTSLLFTWKTTDWDLDNYTIYAYATLGTDEDTENNNCTGGNVWIMFPGDINNDGSINMGDITSAILAFNSMPGQFKWNSYADIDASRRVSMKDIIIIVINFNKIP